MAPSQQKGKLALGEKLEQLFGLDLRSLAAFRIGVALIIIADLIIRFGDIQSLYSDAGVLPLAARREIVNPLYWSLHAISGLPVVQAILFVLAMLIALAFLVGYRTRLAAIASWALLISLQNRNPFLLFAGDDMLRALMFWAMFLPLGAAYSIDSALNTSTKPLPKRILTGATIALTLQVFYVYIFSAAYKTTSTVWWPDLTAVYYALSFDQYAAPLGKFLLNFPPLLTISTLFTLILEWIGPLLILVPFRTVFFRTATVITFILLHVGFGLTLQIGLFPALGIFTWLVFIPSEVWDGIYQRIYTPQRSGLRIYYDADCGFCKKVVHLIRTFLILPKTPLLMAQEDESIYADMREKNSWVVVDWQQNRHYKWEGIAYVVSLSPILWFLAPVLRLPPLMAVGNKFYEKIATNRRIAGNFTKPLKWRPLEVNNSQILNIVTLLLLAYVTVWNFRNFVELTSQRGTLKSKAILSTQRVLKSKTFNSIDWISRVLRIDQSWSIFAPAPPVDDGWYVIPGKLKDGKQVDVLQNSDKVNWEKPSISARDALYRNMQWRGYFINLNRAIGKKLFPYYAKYICRDWNARHQGDKQLKSFEIYLMDEETVPPGQTQTVKKERKWPKSKGSQSCEKL
ncbi:DCC1-like thiol-disulfide oxidoreductase family protein [Microseira sp. BLCC-F43]|jgi:predicted DCC family thiol-disulfide oxidoreductase YuxK|uniref:DCC1-like thiol-disulfide oxidoreductase family protein n=1 Tax=Microseira sp. BLCC-F43 TaxID=3153602 RepID=UPI0035B83907